MTSFKRFAFLTILALCVSTLPACNLFKAPAPATTPDTAEVLEAQLQEKSQTIVKLETRIQALEKQVALLEKENRACLKSDFKTAEPGRLYQKARNLLLENNFIQAGSLFAKFADRYPKHSLVDNAMYWQGECYYSLGQHKKAIEIFKRLTQTYPKADKVPAALLKTGYSYLALGDANRASHFLKQVIKRYPFSSVAEKAQAKLSLID